MVDVTYVLQRYHRKRLVVKTPTVLVAKYADILRLSLYVSLSPNAGAVGTLSE